MCIRDSCQTASDDRTYNRRFVGRLNLALLDLVPVDASEEGVVLDVTLAGRATSQPLCWVLRQQLQPQRHRYTVADIVRQTPGREAIERFKQVRECDRQQTAERFCHMVRAY